MNWIHSSKTAALGVLLATVLIVSGTAAAVSFEAQPPESAQVGDTVTMEVTMTDAFADPLPASYTLQANTQLNNAEFTIRATNVAGDTVLQEDVISDTATVQLNSEDGISEVTIIVEGDVPEMSEFNYQDLAVENYTAMELSRVVDGGTSQLNGGMWAAHRYTEQSQQAREAIDERKEMVDSSDNDNNKEDLDRAIAAYNNGDFETAIDLIETGDQQTGQTGDGTSGDDTADGTDSDGGMGLVPVLVGLLGLGGAGGLWLARRGGGDQPSGGQPSAHSADSPSSGSSTGSDAPSKRQANRIRSHQRQPHEQATATQQSLAPETIQSSLRLSLSYDDINKGEPLGSGGNADVYHATTMTEDGEFELALKEPRMSGTMHTEAVERLLDEAETWQQLDDHDHIVGVVDYGSEPLPWIAMEYMDAGHLGERAEEMRYSQALWTAIVTTKAVRHAHRRGIAHLDLKPENILFRSVDEAWDVPKVADWGLSKHLLEHSKSVEGLSPHYAAPEQFDTEFGPTDDITDVYQLGAVFYELFTGRPPFEGRPTEVMRAVMDEQPTPPSEVADIPPEIDEILLTALATNKQDRYEHVLYLRDDLQTLLDD